MKKYIGTLLISTALFLSGCATVPMAEQAKSDELKKFNAPPADKSAIYVYRKNTILGAGLKKNIYIDDEFIGESAKGTFFYKQVAPGDHKISTESEFSENHLPLKTQGGKNYFIRQYIKLGVFVGGANLEEVSEEQAKKDMVDVYLAQ